jgi:hypothetical protein
MKKKTLVKMQKYCKMKGWRFGQLIANLTADLDYDPFHITDEELSRRFMVMYVLEKPIKVRGGYYPKGHNE